MKVCEVLLFAILEILLVHSARIPKREHLNAYRVHNRRAVQFPCSAPQPRSLSYKDFIDKNKLPDVNSDVLPMMTVLHRCDSQSGCCTRKNEVCTPVEDEIENVTLTFQIITILSDYTTDYAFESVVAKNHTRCECRTPCNKPK